jgi:hypothetical protein
MASLINIDYGKIPQYLEYSFNSLPIETKAYTYLGLSTVFLCLLVYIGYILILTYLEKKQQVYKLEINFPLGSPESEQKYIESMQTFFASIHDFRKDRLSFEIHKTSEYLILLLTTTNQGNVETIRKYLTGIKGLTISLTYNDPLEEYKASYSKKLYLKDSFYTINLQEKATFAKLVDYLASLNTSDQGGVMFLFRPTSDKDEQIHKLIQRNDSQQINKGLKLTRQETATLNLQEKLDGRMFLVQIYTLGSSLRIAKDLSSIFKILIDQNRFYTTSLFGSKNTKNLKSRHLFKENLFTALFRKSFGSYLTSSELALILHPSQNQRGIYKPNKSLIVESSPEFLEAGESTPNTTNTKLLIGSSHLNTGEKRNVYLPVENLRRHLYILGSTGSGKSTVLIRTALSACQDKTKALIFFDPHEVDLQMIAGRLPDLSDVVYFKIDNQNGEQDRKITFNPLFSFGTTDTEKDALAEDILNILEQEAKDGDLGISIKKLLRFLITTGVHFADAYYRYLTEFAMINKARALELVHERQLTIPDLPYILRDKSSYQEMLKKIFLTYGDKNIAYKWEFELANYNTSPNILDGIDNRLSNLLTDSILPILEGNSYRIADFIKENKKVLIPISETGFGNISKKLITKLLLSQTWAYVQHSYNPENETEKVQIIIDEMQEAESPLLPRMLSEARKYGASLILAHQYLNQVSKTFLNSVLGNVGSTLIFNMGNQQEVKEIVGLFAGDIEEKDISNLPPFQGFLRTIKAGNKGRALLSFETMDYRTEFKEINDKERLNQLSNETLAKYGEPVKELYNRRKMKLKSAEKYFLFGL